ncbi:MAG: hypothetical protein AAFR38_03255 [Planctomycetota bacterium]
MRHASRDIDGDFETDLFATTPDPTRLKDEPSPLPAGVLAMERAGLDRSRLIERIMSRNRGATSSFLAQFEDRELSTYLEHLEFSESPRRDCPGWSRPGDAPAIITAQRLA